jgi:hypothetical protein
VSWFKRNLVPSGVGYEQLNAEAKAVAPGSEGLACLDHFQVSWGPSILGHGKREFGEFRASTEVNVLFLFSHTNMRFPGKQDSTH